MSMHPFSAPVPNFTKKSPKSAAPVAPCFALFFVSQKIVMSTDWNAIEEWFYLGDDAENVGPFTTPEIIEFYSQGGITDETYIWCEECDGWETIETFTELRDILVAGAGKASGEEAAPAAPSAGEEKQAPAPAQAEAAKTKAKTMAKRRSSLVKAPSAGTKSNLTLLKELSKKTYLEQAQWFLNAYWKTPLEGEKNLGSFSELPDECEFVWKMYHVICELDKEKGKEGNEVDEFAAHIFLERTVGAITVKKMRQVLVEIDVDFNKMVSLTEAMIYHYKIDYNWLVTAVVDDAAAKARIDAAKAAVEAALQALKDSQAAAEAAKQAAADSAAAAEAAAASAAKAKADAEAAAEAEKLAVDEEARAVAEAEAATSAREAANAAADAATAAREEAVKQREQADAAQTASEAAAAAAAEQAEAAAKDAEAAAAATKAAAEAEAAAAAAAEQASAAEQLAEEKETIAQVRSI